MQSVEFTSVLPEEFKEDLETLLFFNPLQARARAGIVQSLEKYGQPRVHAENGKLRVCVGELPDVQTLYALAVRDEAYELVGLAVYTREGDGLSILHLAVSEAAAGGNGFLALRLASAIRRVGGSVHGIRRVQLPYNVRFQQNLRPAPAARSNERQESHDKIIVP